MCKNSPGLKTVVAQGVDGEPSTDAVPGTPNPYDSFIERLQPTPGYTYGGAIPIKESGEMTRGPWGERPKTEWAIPTTVRQMLTSVMKAARESDPRYAKGGDISNADLVNIVSALGAGGMTFGKVGGEATLGSLAGRAAATSEERGPTFYSALKRGVEQHPQTKATPDQWKGIIANMPGVKKEETDWLRRA